jgi:hypothetical protein
MTREKGREKFNGIVSKLLKNTGGKIGQAIIATFRTISSILSKYMRILEV